MKDEVNQSESAGDRAPSRRRRGRSLGLAVSAGVVGSLLLAGELWCRWVIDMPWLGNSRTLFVPDAFGASAGNHPNSVEIVVAELDVARGDDRRLDSAIEQFKEELMETEELEARARRVTEIMVLVLQGALLVQHAPAAVAEGFCASRLTDDGGVVTAPSRQTWRWTISSRG